MAGFAEYGAYDALGLAELVRTQKVTAVELVEECIARIEKLNPQLNAVIHKLYDRARTQARSGGGAATPQGTFAGVPFLLKDLCSVLAGEPMRHGCRFYGDWRPDRSSATVDRYGASGLIFVGKTSTPELGFLPTTEPERFGPTRNPWDTARSTGGSSGGSAASVAARIVPCAGGGDGGGSIRIPASCCGVFGLKPTRGRTPIGPYAAELWHGFALEHVLSLSVRDSAAMLDVLAGPYLGDSFSLPKPARPFLDEVGVPPGRLKIAFRREPYLPGTLHPDCGSALEETVRLLGELGHEVVEASPRIDGVAFARSFLIMVAAHTWADIRTAESRVGRKAERTDFEQKTWLAVRMGEVYSAGEYVQAVEVLQQLGREVLLFSEGYDLLLCPTVALPPPPLGFLEPVGTQALLEKLGATLPVLRLFKGGATIDQAAAEAFSFIPYTPVMNVSGQPSMSVPLCWNAAGLPIGMMFTARLGDEATLFRLARQLEEARPWRARRPPICAG